MEKEKHIPGLKFVGYISHPQINGGEATPCYDFCERADGKLNINTMEGWNASADENALHNYRKLLGKEPTSISEAVRWQIELVNRDKAIYAH